MAKQSKGLVGRLIDFLSSFGLASALLAFLFLLTLFGTLAQVHDGIYLAQKKYFESWYVFHQQDLWGDFKLVIPMPGALTCLSLLAVNLLLGGLVRIRKNKSTLGVIVIHLGIVVMLAASLTKLTAAEEGRLTLYEGEASDEFIHYYEWEVTVFDVRQQTQVTEWVIPHSQLIDLTDGRTRTFEFPEAGFELELSHFVPNARPLPKGPAWESPAPTVDGFAIKDLGFDAEAAERNVACLYATARVNGAPAEVSHGILWPFDRFPWVVKVGDKEWAVSLQHRRMAMPFEISLDKFTRELHPGTQIPKVYSSDVTKTVLATRDSQKVEISMNEPLRSGGLVLFQSSWGPPDAKEGQPLYSQFSVVRNPSDAWPLYSCIIITIGLLLAFGQKLARYVRVQNANRAKQLGGNPS